MGSITIHELDATLDRRLTEEAKRSRKSKNQFIKEALSRSLGLPVSGRYADDYREFCGLWSTAEWYAEIKRILRKKGRTVPISDVWIAASCMEHGAALLTLDSHFAEIDGLLRV